LFKVQITEQDVWSKRRLRRAIVIDRHGHGLQKVLIERFGCPSGIKLREMLTGISISTWKCFTFFFTIHTVTRVVPAMLHTSKRASSVYENTINRIWVQTNSPQLSIIITQSYSK
jgi:hypothetical protein